MSGPPQYSDPGVGCHLPHPFCHVTTDLLSYIWVNVSWPLAPGPPSGKRGGRTANVWSLQLSLAFFRGPHSSGYVCHGLHQDVQLLGDIALDGHCHFFVICLLLGLHSNSRSQPLAVYLRDSLARGTEAAALLVFLALALIGTIVCKKVEKLRQKNPRCLTRGQAGPTCQIIAGCPYEMVVCTQVH